MKTKREWNASGKNFLQFCKPGEQIDFEIYDDFAMLVPPAMMHTGSFLYGEKYGKDEQGHDTYMCFHRTGAGSYNNDTYYYFGIMSIPQFECWKMGYQGRLTRCGNWIIEWTNFRDIIYWQHELKKEDGWVQMSTDQDSSYFGFWVNQEKKMTFTFIEGDEIEVYCLSDEQFLNEYNDAVHFYNIPIWDFAYKDLQAAVDHFNEEDDRRLELMETSDQYYVVTLDGAAWTEGDASDVIQRVKQLNRENGYV